MADPEQTDLFASVASREVAVGSRPSPRPGDPSDPLLRPPAGRRTVVVGRSGPRTREIRFARERYAPFPGPWSITAVVTGSTRS